MGKYKFKSAYAAGFEGVLVDSDDPPQIHGLMRKLRVEVGGIAAVREKDGPSFPVRKAKELLQKLAQAISDLDMVVLPIRQEVTHQDPDKIPADAKGRKLRSAVHVQTTVRFIAPDGSYLDSVGSGHGYDADDKGGGKADTYAYKVAVLKGLCIPEKDIVDTDDEELGGNEPPAKTPKPPPPGALEAKAAAAAKAKPKEPVMDPATEAEVRKFLSRIEACATADELKALGAEVNANARQEVKTAIFEPYTARRNALARAGSKT